MSVTNNRIFQEREQNRLIGEAVLWTSYGDKSAETTSLHTDNSFVFFSYFRGQLQDNLKTHHNHFTSDPSVLFRAVRL
jgi:hypothetical protein